MSLISEAQWRAIIDPPSPADSIVDQLTGGDAEVISAVLEQASDEVQEYATEAGALLTAGTITPAMVRRVAVIATYAAALKDMENRNASGDVPYAKQYDRVVEQLEKWGKRLRAVSTDPLGEFPIAESDERRWD